MTRLQTTIPAPSGRRGFSLVELLLAIGILGIGLISIAALFPAGILQQRKSIDDVMGTIVADNAIAVIRRRVDADDFGTFDEFGATAPFPTIEGDWGWLRPGVLFDDDGNTTYPDGSAMDDTGFLDLFGHAEVFGGATRAVEFPGGYSGSELVGVPWNTFKYGVEPPRIVITQRERYYPQLSDLSSGADRKPEYIWDCMFRRYQGRIQVAIFVYRVAATGGGRVDYSVAPSVVNPSLPPVPHRLDVVNGFPGGSPFVNNEAVLDWSDGAPFDITNWDHSWQTPRQWLLDQNGNIHRVLNGRRSTTDGPVELVEAPGLVPTPGYPELDPNNTGVWVNRIAPNGSSISALWYIPAVDGNGLTLTPVYATVKEL